MATLQDISRDRDPARTRRVLKDIMRMGRVDIASLGRRATPSSTSSRSKDQRD